MRFCKACWLTFFCIIFAALVQAKVPVLPRHKIKVTATLRTDHSNITPRQFSAKALDEYNSSRDYLYNEALNKQLRFWDYLLFIIARFIQKLLGGVGNATSHLNWDIIKWVIVAVICGFILFVILRISGVDFTFILRKKARKIDLPYIESLENIHEIDFDEQLDNATQTGNYRLAVRLLYLRSLKLLNDSSLINWQINKTNHAYLAELRGKAQQPAFEQLTRHYEYVWYGGFGIGQTEFSEVNNWFINFKNSLPE